MNRLWIGRARRLALAGMLMLLLSGCAEGTSRDADQGREDDAERTSVVDSLQSTASADLVRQEDDATPPAGNDRATEPAGGAEGN